jgi:hypothetical protein
VSLYPNPLTGNTLYLEHNGRLNYVIYNATGQMLIEGKLQPDEKVIYVHELATGVYILKAETDAGISYQRFVKQ